MRLIVIILSICLVPTVFSASHDFSSFDFEEYTAEEYAQRIKESTEDLKKKQQKEGQQQRLKFIALTILQFSLPLILARIAHPMSASIQAMLRVDSREGWWMYAALCGICSSGICLVNGYGSGNVHNSASLELIEILIISGAPTLLIIGYGVYHDFSKNLSRKIIAATGFLIVFLPLPSMKVSGGEYLLIFLIPLILTSLSLLDERKARP